MLVVISSETTPVMRPSSSNTLSSPGLRIAARSVGDRLEKNSPSSIDATNRKAPVSSSSTLTGTIPSIWPGTGSNTSKCRNTACSALLYMANSLKSPVVGPISMMPRASGSQLLTPESIAAIFLDRSTVNSPTATGTSL